MDSDRAATDRAAGPPLFDEVDRALVLELQHDGRASYAKLAAQVGMSQASVRSRVQRLLESGAVKVVAVADPFAFGFTVTAMLGIRCVGDLLEVGAALADLEPIHFVAVVSGRHDLIAEVVCTNGDELLELVNDRIRAVPAVREVEILTYLRLLKQWQPEFVRSATPAPRRRGGAS